MRKEMRYEQNDEYWDKRWLSAKSDAEKFENLNIYPIRYAEMVVSESNGIIAEFGCGLGRVVKHYHYQGKNIMGIEKSEVAVKRMKSENPELKAEQGDILKLPFPDDKFSVILAFGLFHNVEEGMVEAVKEALRCLKIGGKFCISMRPDNFEMRLNNYYWCMKNKRKEKKTFHKWLVTEKEFKEILEINGSKVEKIYRAKNVSIFWRIPFFRKSFAERGSGDTENRSKGYQLNALGQFFDKLMTGLFPASFCNVLVFIGEKIRNT